MYRENENERGGLGEKGATLVPLELCRWDTSSSDAATLGYKKHGNNDHIAESLFHLHQHTLPVIQMFH